MSNSLAAQTAQRDALILEHYPMVRRVAYRMVSRYPSCVEVDDLVSIGVQGLIEAVDRYEADRNASFAAYARIRVKGTILDALRESDWVPRSVRDRNGTLSKSRDHLRRNLGTEPTATQLADHLGLEVSALHDYIKQSTPLVLVSSAEQQDEDGQSVGDRIADNGPSPEVQAAGSFMTEAIDNALADLPDRERQIVELYYRQGVTFREIGERLNVTESRVCQLHARLKRRLESRLARVVDAL
jgi:RNA polymerase sigma factor for flagellar operon FliA